MVNGLVGAGPQLGAASGGRGATVHIGQITVYARSEAEGRAGAKTYAGKPASKPGGKAGAKRGAKTGAKAPWQARSGDDKPFRPKAGAKPGKRGPAPKR